MQSTANLPTVMTFAIFSKTNLVKLQRMIHPASKELFSWPRLSQNLLRLEIQMYPKLGDDVVWQSATLDEPLKGINIDEEKCAIISFPEAATIKIYDELYIEQNKDLYWTAWIELPAVVHINK